MFRKSVFWLHLSAGVTTGVFILISPQPECCSPSNDSARPSVMVAERFVIDGSPVRPRRARCDRRSQSPSAAVQFSLGRSKIVYLDPYSSAVLGVSSPKVNV